MNRRAFLARSLRIPAAVAVLPFLGGLATLAGATEPEAQSEVYTLAAGESWAPAVNDTRIMVWSASNLWRLLSPVFQGVRYFVSDGYAVISRLGMSTYTVVGHP